MGLGAQIGAQRQAESSSLGLIDGAMGDDQPSYGVLRICRWTVVFVVIPGQRRQQVE